MCKVLRSHVGGIFPLLLLIEQVSPDKEIPNDKLKNIGMTSFGLSDTESQVVLASYVKTSKEDDPVVQVARVREGASVLTVAENGLGRRVPLESYKVQNRGGYGLMNYKSGGVCGIKVVDDEDDIIMISTDGIVIRIRACDISMMSRYSRGVRLMRVGEDGRVVSFTRTEHDDDVETAEVEKATAEEIAEAQAEENAEVIEDNTESVENEDSENTEE